jgi:hypothetical protein
LGGKILEQGRAGYISFDKVSLRLKMPEIVALNLTKITNLSHKKEFCESSIMKRILKKHLKLLQTFTSKDSIRNSFPNRLG